MQAVPEPYPLRRSFLEERFGTAAAGLVQFNSKDLVDRDSASLVINERSRYHGPSTSESPWISGSSTIVRLLPSTFSPQSSWRLGSSNGRWGRTMPGSSPPRASYAGRMPPVHASGKP